MPVVTLYGWHSRGLIKTRRANGQWIAIADKGGTPSSAPASTAALVESLNAPRTLRPSALLEWRDVRAADNLLDSSLAVSSKRARDAIAWLPDLLKLRAPT